MSSVIPVEPEVQEDGVSSQSQAEREPRQAEVRELLREFAPALRTDRNQKNLRFYAEQRSRGRENWEAITAAEARGEDITDAVLMKLLPHANTVGNRERGAWVTVTPAITKDLKQWFDASGTPRDWPAVAREVMRFLKTVVADPGKLEEASRDFVASPHTKGMQTAFVSPMLNALRPDDFLVINSKPRDAINYFTGMRFGNSLVEYAGLNRVGWELIGRLEPALREAGGTEARPEDIFDQFSHWLRAEKRFAFGKVDRSAEPEREATGVGDDSDTGTIGESATGEVGYWKVAPGESGWQWEECKREGFIAMGWEELGDCHGLSKDVYLQRRAEAIEAGHIISPGDMQPWIFANEIKPGDRIVANRGRDEVLGIGTVTGPYEFVPDVRHGHRLPVRWDHTEPFVVKRRAWLKTLARLDQTSFDAILAEREANGDAADGPVFTVRAFELLEGLRQSPTKAYATEHKDELRSLVEEPFKRLFHRTAKMLPPGILSRMESEQKCFGRFLKNDYGQGGAYPYYWGALYPRGGKRTEDAQLFLWIRADYFGYGFSIGQHGSTPSERFCENLKVHRGELDQLLGASLSELNVVYGGPAELSSEERVRNGFATKSLMEWLLAPDTFGYDVRLQFTREEMLTIGEGTVARRIASAFEKFFPLVLLTIPGDPMPEIRRLVEGGSVEQSDISGVHETGVPMTPSPQSPGELHPPYSFEKLVDETGFAAEKLEQWLRALERKKQAVLYGPPGTGKTYLAERLARHLVEGTDAIVEVLQFHPSYSYEEFMQGLRPRVLDAGALTYEWQDGRFVDFCARARTRSGKSVPIIDEINRANLASVFGELMYLLEYRDSAIPLPGGARFSIPDNVRVIGTMNTADRSIALVDHALRRRFAFLPLFPDYDLLRRRAPELGFPVEGLIRVLEQINESIIDRNYALGVSFFLNASGPADLQDIWSLEIEPYLEELFFDQPTRIDQYRWQAIRDQVLSA